MPQTAAELLEAVRKLPRDEQFGIAEALLGDLSEDWHQSAAKAEPGYEEWFRAGIEEARTDSAEEISHEQVVAEVNELLRSASEARRLKASA